MKTNYSTKKLEDVTEFQSGLWAGEKGPFVFAKVIRNTNFRNNDGTLNLDNVAEIEVEEKQFKDRLLKKGDIILERSGGGPTQPVGRVVYFDETDDMFSFSNFTTRIRIICSDLDSRYLWYFLHGFYLSGKTIGMQKKTTGIHNLTFSEYKNIEIPLPSLSEQKKIVAKLEKVSGKIKEAKRLRAEAESAASTLLSAELHRIFQEGKQKGWEEKEMQNCTKFIDYRGKTPVKTHQGLRLITAKNVKLGYLSLTPQEYVDESIYDSWMTRGIPQKGDILFTTEAPLGNVAELDTDGKVVFAQRVIIIQPSKELLGGFLKYILMGSYVRKNIMDQATGATALGIKAAKLKKIKIPLPPLVEQKKIVTHLDALSAKIAELQSHQKSTATALSALEKSVLAKAFQSESRDK